ncbi:hypothetical protein BU14_0223s0005 [Porphyra umbilicalis]|uniref:Uncharacterized protein n=1 Tax=Porphyra umbilicalis TaxID=2786 RepID=A0A1X6P4D7_PORUM|nr:hypothetical protein BU14_0223s0005 [Porphyra umbilicalis]|eukprot:OSX75732.1 hypothetical protein BU14_0223s0005 [Porphyra umbilicalis]
MAPLVARPHCSAQPPPSHRPLNATPPPTRGPPASVAHDLPPRTRPAPPPTSPPHHHVVLPPLRGRLGRRRRCRRRPANEPHVCFPRRRGRAPPGRQGDPCPRRRHRHDQRPRHQQRAGVDRRRTQLTGGWGKHERRGVHDGHPHRLGRGDCDQHCGRE